MELVGPKTAQCIDNNFLRHLPQLLQRPASYYLGEERSGGDGSGTAINLKARINDTSLFPPQVEFEEVPTDRIFDLDL